MKREIWRIPFGAFAELLAKEVGLVELEVLDARLDFETDELLIKVHHQAAYECREGEPAHEYRWNFVCDGRRGEIEAAGK